MRSFFRWTETADRVSLSVEVWDPAVTDCCSSAALPQQTTTRSIGMHTATEPKRSGIPRMRRSWRDEMRGMLVPLHPHTEASAAGQVRKGQFITEG